MIALAAGCGRVDFGEATRVADFSAHGDHSCARHTCASAKGQLWCWGINSAMQLGNGVLGDSAVPVRAWAGPDAL